MVGAIELHLKSRTKTIDVISFNSKRKENIYTCTCTMYINSFHIELVEVSDSGF